jgi:thiol-disulfide isomerase/thioredoxin
VNIWNTTCGPCSRELKYFGEVDRELGGGVRFVGVDPLPEGADGRMEEFAAVRGVDYELYIDDRYELFDALGVVSFPLTLFVAADGTIVAQAGEVSESELREHVARLLA